MSRRTRTSLLVVALLVAAACALLIVGCGGTPSSSAPTTAATGTPMPATTTTTKVVVLDFLSTFQAKDPFIQQVVSTTKGTGPSTTGQGGSTTTTRGSTTTTRPSSTTTPYPTQTTSGSHYLKLLSVSTANGVAVCTFEVDRVVYQDKKVGDVVSTSWGQIKVLAISTVNQTVTFQHGSETRTLSVGQQIVK